MNEQETGSLSPLAALQAAAIASAEPRNPKRILRHEGFQLSSLPVIRRLVGFRIRNDTIYTL